MASLSRLLAPSSIAVFGGTWAHNVIEQCRRMGYRGNIWPVHPSRDEIEGVRCYRSVSALPHAPDAAFIGVNRAATVDLVAQLAACGAGGAVCFASGFSEAEAEDDAAPAMQQALLAAAQEMPIIGPNCYGFVNYLDGAPLWPDQHGGMRVTSGVALITQSSNIAINMSMQQRGLPIAYVVTVGNQAQLGIAHIGTHLLSDERVTALGLYIEGFSDLRAFEAMSRLAHQLNKPVVVLKPGRSHQARAASASHTASLAGQFAGARALLERLGFALVNSVAVFLETLKLHHVAGPLQGRRLASMSSSGGEAALIADNAQLAGVEFPSLPATTEQALRKWLGPRVYLANPLDYHTYIWGDVQAMREVYLAVMDAGYDLTVLVLDIPRADHCDPSSYLPAVEAFVDAARQRRHTGAVGLLSLMGENLSEAWAERFREAGIVPLHGLDHALAAADAAATWLEYVAPDTPLLLPCGTDQPCAGRAMARRRLLRSPIDTGERAEPVECMLRERLADCGVPFAPWCYAGSQDALVAATKNLTFPLALKACGVAHKTESAALQLGLQSTQSVLDAANAMPAAAQGWLLESMVNDALAELLVGIVHDAAHGYVLTLGAGGTDTELLRDRVSVLLPVAPEQILTALKRLRIYPKLTGFRGQPGVAMDALVKAVQGLAKFVTDHHGVIEDIEINPLILREHDAVAVDALLHMRQAEHE